MLCDYETTHWLYCELLHPSRAPFQWTDVIDYARFLITQRLFMRAFRVVRKCDLLEHPVGGIVASQSLIFMSSEEEQEEEKKNKLIEAMEIATGLKYSKECGMTEDIFVERKKVLMRRIKEMIGERSTQSKEQKEFPKSTQENSKFSKDIKEIEALFKRKEYSSILAIGSIYGSSPLAIPNQFISVYLYSLYKEGKSSELQQLGQWLVDEQGHLPFAWYGVSLYYKLLKNQEKTKRYLIKSISKDSNFIEGWIGLGEFYSGSTGDHDLALKALGKGLELSILQGKGDYSEWTRILLSNEYLRVKKPREALEVLEVGNVSNPSCTNELVVNQRAVALYQLGRINEAWELIKESYMFSDEGKINAASIAVKLEDFDTAKTILSKVEHKNREIYWKLNGFVNEMLGMTRLAKNHLASAIDSYSRLLTMDPEDIFTREAQGKILTMYKYLQQQPASEVNSTNDDSDNDMIECDCA